jgi:uncharacterized protein (DUF362 family)
MKRRHGVALCLVGLLLLAWAGGAFAGPKVAIVRGDEKILKDSTILPQEFITFQPKDPQRGRDNFWTLQFKPESIKEVERMVRQAVALAGGWPVKKGDTVFIKFNANNDMWFLLNTGHGNANDFTCTNSDARVARAVALMCKESGAKKIIIGETTGVSNSLGAMRVWGCEMAVRDAGAELVDLDRVPYKWVPAPQALVYPEYAIPQVVLDADVVISIGPLKTHSLAGTTFCLKNIGIGVPPNQVYGSPKIGLRHDMLHKTIADVCHIVKIRYNLISGIYGGEGLGPTRCDAVYHGIVIAGKDPVAVDYVGSACMGFMPERYGYLRVAQETGLGTYKDIEVVGNKIEEVMITYKQPAEHAPGASAGVWGW